MKRRITDIQTHERRRSRCLIYLDGEPYREVDHGLITRFGLHVGQEIEEAALHALIEQDEIPRAKQYAFDLLVRQAYTRAEMEQKLRRKGFGEGAISQTLQTLERLGYIRDDTYAADWIAQRNRHRPRGRRLLRLELQRKGIDKTTIDRVLADIDDEQELDLARQAATKQMRHYQRLKPAIARRRLYHFLQRRGFEAEICRQVVEEALSVNDPEEN